MMYQMVLQLNDPNLKIARRVEVERHVGEISNKVVELHQGEGDHIQLQRMIIRIEVGWMYLLSEADHVVEA